jgi:hypothetical protein
MFRPFTAAEATLNDFVSTPLCLRWPEPDRPTPIARPGADFPDVPTFVLGGDLDNIVPFRQARWVAKRFPRSRLVKFAGAGHGAAFSGPCGFRLVSRFVRTLRVGDASCARRLQGVFPGVGKFPASARRATPSAVDKGAGNEANVGKRRIAGVVVGAVRDAVARAWLAFEFGSRRVRGRGLRGGWTVFRYKGRFGLNWVMRLHRVRFAKNVAVSGVARWPGDGSFRSRLRVRGPGPADGRLTVRTGFYPQGKFTVRGHLRDSRVAVVVPEL